MPSNSYDPKVHTRWLDLLLSIWRCSGQELNGQVGPIFLNGQMGNRTVFLLTQSCTGPSFQTGKKCDNKLERMTFYEAILPLRCQSVSQESP